jgi:hypothetical protein
VLASKTAEQLGAVTIERGGCLGMERLAVERFRIGHRAGLAGSAGLAQSSRARRDRAAPGAATGCGTSFPQIAAFGSSAMARRYAIRALEEARSATALSYVEGGKRSVRYRPSFRPSTSERSLE